jgi:hypothetical protein
MLRKRANGHKDRFRTLFAQDTTWKGSKDDL